MEKKRKMIQLMCDLKKANEGLNVYFHTKIVDNEKILLVFILKDKKRIKLGYFSWDEKKRKYEDSLRKQKIFLEG